MFMGKTPFSLLLHLVFTSAIYGQVVSYDFENFGVREGLSSDFVQIVFQDSYGYIWIGARGVDRYDGYDFKCYYEESPANQILKGNLIMDIFEDYNRDLWVGTNQGLSKYDRERDRFVYYDFMNIGQPVSVSTIEEINNGELIFGLTDSVVVWNKANNTLKTIFVSVGNSFRFSLLKSKKRLLIGGRKVLVLYDLSNGQFTDLTGKISNIVKDWKVECLLETSQGDFWVGTDLGLVNLDENLEIKGFYNQNSKTLRIPNQYVLSLIEQTPGVIWIGTDGGGIKVLDIKQMKSYDIKSSLIDGKGLSSNTVRSFYKDNNGNIWLATFEGGVCFLNKNRKKFNSFKENSSDPNSLNYRVVTSFAEDREGIIWIGTDKGGINRFDPSTRKFKSIKLNPSQPGLEMDFVLDIAMGPNNELWAANWLGGLNCYNTETGFNRNYLHNPDNINSLSGNNVWSLCIDKYNNIWASINFGRWSGIDKKIYGKEGFQHYSAYSSLPYGKISGHDIVKVFADSKGNLWFGGNGSGLDLYKPKSNTIINYVHRPDDSTTLCGNNIRDIVEDFKGRLWIGTDLKGFCKFNPERGTFTRYNLPADISENTVNSIMPDSVGGIWLGTSRGLCYFLPETNVFKIYTERDGLPSNQFRPAACLLSSNGIAYFGTNDGFVAFKPAEITDNQNIAPLRLTEFLLFNEKITPDQEGSPLSKDISLTSEIVLSHNQNFFTFKFASIDFMSNRKNKYKVILEGAEQQWTYLGEKREITYRNIEPGKYMFKVLAANGDGYWMKEPVMVKVQVLPPWYKTTVFKMILIILLISLIFLWLRVRTQLLKQRTRRLESLVEKRTLEIVRKNQQLESSKVEIEEQKNQIEEISRKLHEADQAKIRFFMNISHELRTPLSLILNPVEKILESGSLTSKDGIVRELSLVKRNAQWLLALVSELLELQKGELNLQKLNLSEVEVVSFVREITSMFNTLSTETDIKVELTASPTQIMWNLDMAKFSKVIHNLISNAFKYNFNGGEIRIGISSENRMLFIKVYNSGNKIKDEELPHLFERFYTSQSQGMLLNGAIGIGLALVKEFVELHGGNISIDNSSDGGNTFVVVIPQSESQNNERENQINSDQLQRVNSGINIIVPDNQSVNSHTENYPPNSYSILIAEDNEDMLRFLSEYLAETYYIIEASDGNMALTKATEYIPDLIISDIMMPGMDGIELVKRLKMDLRTSHIPIILLTAQTRDENKIAGLSTGADDYLTKPFNLTELYIRIRNLLTARERLKSQYQRDLLLDSPLPKGATSDEIFMRKVLECLDKNLSDPNFDVNTFASEVAMGRTLFYKKLRTLTGYSVNEFIKIHRLKKAHQLFEFDKALTISEVAFQVGFNDPKYFSRCYKSLYGSRL